MAETIYEYTKATMPDLSEILPAVQESTMTQDGKDDYEASRWSETDEKLYCKFTDALISADETKFDAIVAALDDDPGTVLPKFGAWYKAKGSSGLSTTTSSDWQDKITLNTPWLDAGTYRVAVVYQWYYTNITTDFEARVVLDLGESGENQIFIHRQEPKDAGTDQRLTLDYFREKILTEGKHSFTLQWKSGNESATAGIRNARLEVYEVDE